MADNRAFVSLANAPSDRETYGPAFLQRELVVDQFRGMVAPDWSPEEWEEYKQICESLKANKSLQTRRSHHAGG